MRARTASLAIVLAVLSGCAPAIPGEGTPARSPIWSLSEPLRARAAATTPASFQAARTRLAALRLTASRPRTLRVALAAREPMTGRTLSARGAVAIAPLRSTADSLPAESLRMILLGPGGTTSVDLWLNGDTFRFAVPALRVLRRGDATTPRASLHGMPIDLLHWWLLRPAEGRLLWALREESAHRLLLRDGPAIIDLRLYDDGRIEARRTTWSTADAGDPTSTPRRIDEETLTAEAFGCATVHYQQASSMFELTVKCEGEDAAPPAARAFANPDDPAPPSASP